MYKYSSCLVFDILIRLFVHVYNPRIYLLKKKIVSYNNLPPHIKKKNNKIK